MGPLVNERVAKELGEDRVSRDGLGSVDLTPTSGLHRLPDNDPGSFPKAGKRLGRKRCGQVSRLIIVKDAISARTSNHHPWS